MNQNQRILFAVAILVLCAWLVVRRYANVDLSSRHDSQTQSGVYQPPFHEEWRHQHDILPFECWTDDGYDPSRSGIPRDIQLLAGMDYGKADIDNGGFHQFFSNGTGVFAPEMVEWCDRSGLRDVADVIRLAMKTLADDYPRSQAARQRLLEKFPVRGRREDWDPFKELDQKFYTLLTNNGSRYDEAADRWLLETCGITKLDDPP